MSLLGAFRHYLVRALEAFWKLIGSASGSHGVQNVAGHVVHRLMCRYQERTMASYTRFFRNVPQLDALAHLVRGRKSDAALRVAVLGCSTGAEVYSAVWTVRSARPDLTVECVGLDISESAVLAARQGIYASDSRELEGVSAEALDLVFDRHNSSFVVKELVLKGVKLLVGDACDKRLSEILRPQDIVMANNFLIHHLDREAEACLYSIEKLLVPSGAFFVWGVDLDVKTRVMKVLGMEPLPFNLENIYQADRVALEAWPLKWWGLEPLDKARPDWIVRYCTVFRKPEKSPS